MNSGDYNPYSYTFTRGVPTAITLQATPTISDVRQDANIGIFAQDRWTVGRLKLNGAVRFDKNSAAEVQLGPGFWFPNRNITFPATVLQRYKDVT